MPHHEYNVCMIDSVPSPASPSFGNRTSPSFGNRANTMFDSYTQLSLVRAELGSIVPSTASAVRNLLARTRHERADVRQAAVEALASAAPRGEEARQGRQDPHK